MRARTVIASAWLCMLSACASAPPPAMPCVAGRPVAPSLPAVPASGIFAQAQALLARDKLHAAYARQLEALLDACL